MSTAPLLEARQLSVHFEARSSLFGKASSHQAVRDVSFQIQPGETLGLVGESGSGKTTLARAVLRLQKITSGQILYAGTDITTHSGRELRRWRRRVQMIHQDPVGSLDPRMNVEQIISEGLVVHGLARSRGERRERVETLLKSVGLTETALDRFPHEFSGGQRQRIGIARALAVEPELLVCDEPVSALDVSVQAQVVNLLADLQASRGLSYLFIGHDLALVEHVSDRIMVMYRGSIVESGEAGVVCGSPKHPYTRSLITSIPGNGAPITAAPDSSPSSAHFVMGCPYQNRCPAVEPKCRTQMPELRMVGPGHNVACHLAE